MPIHEDSSAQKRHIPVPGPPEHGQRAIWRAQQRHKVALTFVVLLGVVSLFADMTYEGSRSIWGPYLGTLGATGAIVGLIAGGGELLGYVLRLFTGALADKTRRYWTITIVGYAINLLAVPALALADWTN